MVPTVTAIESKCSPSRRHPYSLKPTCLSSHHFVRVQYNVRSKLSSSSQLTWVIWSKTVFAREIKLWLSPANFIANATKFFLCLFFLKQIKKMLIESRRCCFWQGMSKRFKGQAAVKQFRMRFDVKTSRNFRYKPKKRSSPHFDAIFDRISSGV